MYMKISIAPHCLSRVLTALNHISPGRLGRACSQLTCDASAAPANTQISISPLTSLSLLHTYLLGRTAIKQAVPLRLSPSLHREAAKSYDLPSGTSPGEFLMVFL
jgi:hypothetical protein